jgi:hypothetical protein
MINTKGIDWKSLKIHQYVILSALLIVLVKWLGVIFVNPLGMMYQMIGLIMGFFLIYGDKLVNEFVNQGKLRSHWLTWAMDEDADRTQQMTRGWVFFGSLLLIGFFVATSNWSWWVRGFVGGILWHLMYDMIVDMTRGRLADWQVGVKLKMAEIESRKLSLVMIGLGIFIWWWL